MENPFVVTKAWQERNGMRYCEILSQNWRGLDWKHGVLYAEPLGCAVSETVLLEVSGDDAGEPDDHFAQELADKTGSRVVVLFGVPNQPLWEMREDDLIAHTFEEFVREGKKENLLLVPMVRAVLSAIEFLKSESLIQAKKIVVMGGSKRGWTSWLVASIGFPEVIGIAPLVFDNLNMKAQMKRQLELWGEPSKEIEDYSIRELHQLALHDDSHELIEVVDPYSYLGEIQIPVLNLVGSHDPYWAPDATRYYEQNVLKMSHLCIANMGHSNGFRDEWMPTLKHFVSCCEEKRELPQVKLDLHRNEMRLSFTEEPESHSLWVCPLENNHPVEMGYKRFQVKEHGFVYQVSALPLPCLVMVEAIYSHQGQEYKLTSSQLILS